MKSYLQLLAIAFLIFLYFSPQIVNAQDNTKDYSPLEIQGPIPSPILTKSYRKSQIQIKNRDSEQEKRRTREAKDGYILQTNYILDRLLESSQLLFNTELNKTIEAIAKKLLKDEPELYETFTFYIIKTSATNAFATDRGDVFVTMGLLARIKTEAELAFILAHEIIHTEEKHSMQSFDRQLEIKEDSRFRRQGSVDFLMEKSNFSKEKEIEADSKGLDLYSKANYRFADIQSVFNTLEYGHAPVFRDSIYRSSFELASLKIRDGLWLSTPNPIKAFEQNAEYGTHPDIKLRVENVQELLVVGAEADKRQPFDIFSETEFLRLMKRAQLELSLIYLTEKEYSKSLYHTSILLGEFPENKYLQRNFVYAIYAYAQHDQLSDDTIDELLYEDDAMQGEPSKIHFFLDKMTQKELTVFATAHTFTLAQKYPDDDQIERMAQDMAEDLVIYTIENPDDYFIATDTDSLRNFFTRTAFSDYLEDEKFRKYLADGKQYRKEGEEREAYQETRKGQVAKTKKERKKRVNGERLGLDKVVFINPFYFKGKLNALGEISQDYEKSELGQVELLSFLKESSDKIGMQTQILDINTLRESTDIKKLKDIRLIEQFGDELYSNPGYITSLYHNETRSLIDKYNTSNFAYLGVAGLNNKARARQERKRSVTAITYTYSILLFPELGPYLIYRLVKGNNEMFYYTSVFDILTYQKKMEDFNYINMQDKDEVVKTHLYWSLQQMKNK